MMDRTLSLIDPRCTGIWGALATRLPSTSKIAQEKSSRSFTFTEKAVFARVVPICSAIDMNRLLKTSSMTGSASVPIAVRAGLGMTLRRNILLSIVISAAQPGSTTVVATGSEMTAGPATESPGLSCSRAKTGVSRCLPSIQTGYRPRIAGGPERGSFCTN